MYSGYITINTKKYQSKVNAGIVQTNTCTHCRVDHNNYLTYRCLEFSKGCCMKYMKQNKYNVVMYIYDILIYDDYDIYEDL